MEVLPVREVPIQPLSKLVAESFSVRNFLLHIDQGGEKYSKKLSLVPRPAVLLLPPWSAVCGVSEMRLQWTAREWRMKDPFELEGHSTRTDAAA